MVAITSGSNINFERLRLVAELAELGSNAEHMLASTISGDPGSLQAFVETATANKENITELRHRCAANICCFRRIVFLPDQLPG